MYSVRFIVVLAITLLLAVPGLSQDGETEKSKVLTKSHEKSVNPHQCQEWRRIEIAKVILCVPKDLKSVQVNCIHSSCHIFESENFILNIDDDIGDAPYPTSQTKYPSYSEETFETNFGTAWMWFYENEGEFRYVSGARFWDKTNEKEVLRVSFVSKTLPVRAIGERIFRSVEFKKTPKQSSTNR
jgi:hypothetical protein